VPLQISSTQNQRIKQIVKLTNRRERDRRQQTVVEGVRETARALASGLTPTEAYICPPLVDAAEGAPILAHLQRLREQGRTELFEVTPAIFEKISYRGESGGLLLVVPYLHHTLADLPLSQPPFLIILEGIEKPGNLGAILRTADAAGVDGLIVCAEAGAPTTDIHNPNVIRASLGALFTVPVVVAENGRLGHWLQQHNIHIIAATPQASQSYLTADMTQAIAILLGSEADGLSQTWLEAAGQRVSIPMRGMVDSLNLSVATALLLYEVVRQRNGRFQPARPPDTLSQTSVPPQPGQEKLRCA
jgi:RNA methyltransferase, TrmH family